MSATALLTRRGQLIAGGVLVAALGGVGWLAFGPSDACADPACARERFAIYVEVDAFREVQRLDFVSPDVGRRATPDAVLATGGVRVQVQHDQDDLPYAVESGPLDRADLLQYAQVWRNRTPPLNADASLYALLTPALISDAGERLFGLMFDVQGREGFAIAPSETERAFKDQSADTIALLQQRTFTHELLHALNRHHLDAAPLRGGRLTIEAPTRCISNYSAGQWSLLEAPLMALSPGTILFFQTAAPRDVLPGRANTPYRQMRTSATECEDLRTGPPRMPLESRWRLMRKRLLRLSAFQSALAQTTAEEGSDEAAGDPAVEPAPANASVELRLQSQPAAYLLGYPIAVRISAMNTGQTELPLRDRLAPAYGLVQIERREVGEPEEAWRAIKPIVLYEPVTDEAAMVAPGEQTDQTAPVYFGEEGWTFTEPGDYELRARLLTGDEDAVSNTTLIRVRLPDTKDDRAAVAALLDADGRLDPNMGRLLLLGGRGGERSDLEQLASVAQQLGHTALGAALRLVIISHGLIPPIDPRTGERGAPDLVQTERLLRDACADSGVAALTHQLLERVRTDATFNESDEVHMTPRTSISAWAWDGTDGADRIVPTYSDASLGAFGPSVHFCFDAITLDDAAQRRARRLARDVRRANPARVVVVGHADHAAECVYNERLALRRAAAVARLLRDAGIAASRIQTVSLGERRPLDFAAAEEAWLSNRRVEILVEGAADMRADEERIAPRCPSRPSPQR